MIKLILKHNIIDMCINLLYENAIDNFIQFPNTMRGYQITRGCEGLYIYYAENKNGSDIRNRCPSSKLYCYPLKIKFTSYHEREIESFNFRGDIVLSQTVHGSFGYGFSDNGIRVKNDDILYLVPRMYND